MPQVLGLPACIPHPALFTFLECVFAVKGRILYSSIFIIYYLDWVKYMKGHGSCELVKENEEKKKSFTLGFAKFSGSSPSAYKMLKSIC